MHYIFIFCQLGVIRYLRDFVPSSMLFFPKNTTPDKAFRARYRPTPSPFSITLRTAAHNAKRRHAGRDAGAPSRLHKRLEKLATARFSRSHRAELPEDAFRRRSHAGGLWHGRFPFISRAHSFRPFTGQSRLGFCNALGAQPRAPDVPVLAISGTGFMFTANEMATAIRHRIALVTVCSMTAPSQCPPHPAGTLRQRLIGNDLANPDFVVFGKSFGAEACAHELTDCAWRCGALSCTVTSTLIEVPSAPLLKPWKFIQMAGTRQITNSAYPHRRALPHATT